MRLPDICFFDLEIFKQHFYCGSTWIHLHIRVFSIANQILTKYVPPSPKKQYLPPEKKYTTPKPPYVSSISPPVRGYTTPKYYSTIAPPTNHYNKPIEEHLAHLKGPKKSYHQAIESYMSTIKPPKGNHALCQII